MPIDAPGRVGALLTLLLCTVNIFNAAETKYPKNSNAVAQWIMLCMFYIILAIVEYAILLSYRKYINPAKVTGELTTDQMGEIPIEKICNRVDKFTLLIFPPPFIFSATLFWSLYAMSN